jgi:hypothetical protein
MSHSVLCYIHEKAIRLPIMGEIPVVDMESELNIKKSESLLNIIQKLHRKTIHHFGQILWIVKVKNMLI